MPDTFLVFFCCDVKYIHTMINISLFSTFSLVIIHFNFCAAYYIRALRLVYIPLFFARTLDYDAIAILSRFHFRFGFSIFSVFCANSSSVVVVQRLYSVSQHINYYNNLYLFLRFVQFFFVTLACENTISPPSLSKTIVFKLFSTLLLLLLLLL